MELGTDLIKLWPQVAVRAWRSNNGGAYRAWRLAHHIDKSGSGKVIVADFRGYLKKIGIKKSTRNRWIKAAIDLGLFVVGSHDSYYPVGLAKAAIILGCDKVGSPAKIKQDDFIDRAWRPVVWAAWHTAYHRPISQRTKEKITGIPSRTQRNYLSKVKIEKIKNYTRRDIPNDYKTVKGCREVTGKVLFVNEQNEVIQRLPDLLEVPRTIALEARRGRSRKAQRQLDKVLFQEVQHPSIKRCARLWHYTRKGLKMVSREIAAGRVMLQNNQDDFFLESHGKGRAVFWDNCTQHIYQ